MVLSAVGCTAVAATNWNRILVEARAAARSSRIPSRTLPLAKSRPLHSCCSPAPWAPQIRSGPAYQITSDRQLAMAEPLASSQGAPNPPASEQRVVVANKHGENLVGVLHHTGSNKVVVLCHGFTATKDDGVIVDLTAALTKKGISVFRFDFSGNGESEGEFQYGNYRKEADDLHSVVSYLSQEKYDVTTIVGRSKGGDVVVLYASIYGDVAMVINLSGRFDLKKGVEERLGKEFMDRINKEGYIDVTDKSGKFWYRVTKESLLERLNTDMRAASLSISKECRFFTIHGSADEVIPVEDAYEFAKLIPNHKLRVIEGANHCYTAHRKELSDAVVDCITTNEAGDTSA